MANSVMDGNAGDEEDADVTEFVDLEVVLGDYCAVKPKATVQLRKATQTSTRLVYKFPGHGWAVGKVTSTKRCRGTGVCEVNWEDVEFMAEEAAQEMTLDMNLYRYAETDADVGDESDDSLPIGSWAPAVVAVTAIV